MGMSCFLVQKWMRIIKVSCFSVHFCPHLSLIPCFVCICLHILQIFVWFCVVRCSLWHAVPESSWSFNAILRCFLRAVYGNVVFSRSKMHARQKSLPFLRSLVITALSGVNNKKLPSLSSASARICLPLPKLALDSNELTFPPIIYVGSKLFSLKI